jgi:hypothetical protein
LHVIAKLDVLLIKGICGEGITKMGVVIKHKYILPLTVFGKSPKEPHIDPLKIDKLAITLNIPSMKERELLDKKLKKMAMEHHQFAIPLLKNKYKYKNAYWIFVDDNYVASSPERAKICVHTGPSTETHNYMRVEFNPSKVPPFFVKEHMDNLLKDGYSRLMSDGRVTKWDEAVDIHFCELKNLYLYYPKMPWEMKYSKSGCNESIYLGKFPGKKYLCIYDKTKEIKETNANFHYDPQNAIFTKEPVPSYPILRFELRQNLSKKSASMTNGVKNLPHEISKLKIYNRVLWGKEPALKTKTDEMIFKQFLCNCNHEGLHQARLLLTPDWRKKIDPIMVKTKVEWWKPDNIAGQKATVIDAIMFPPTLPTHHKPFFKALTNICN